MLFCTEVTWIGNCYIRGNPVVPDNKQACFKLLQFHFMIPFCISSFFLCNMEIRMETFTPVLINNYIKLWCTPYHQKVQNTNSRFCGILPRNWNWKSSSRDIEICNYVNKYTDEDVKLISVENRFSKSFRFIAFH